MRLIDHVDAAFSAHNTAVAVPVLERAERITNLHGRSPHVVARASAGLRAVRFCEPVNHMVGDTGIEPVTPSMSTKCSTAELIALVADAVSIPQTKMGREKTRRCAVYKR